MSCIGMAACIEAITAYGAFLTYGNNRNRISMARRAGISGKPLSW